MKLKFQRKFKKILNSKIIFDKKLAKKFSKTAYYMAQAKNMKAYEFLQEEKRRLSTPKREVITNLLAHYKGLGDSDWKLSSTKILLGIYKKNKDIAITNKVYNDNKLGENSKLLDIVANPYTLLLAYRAIKGNKGALTKAGDKSQDEINGFNDLQLLAYYKSRIFPDQISLRDFLLIGSLIKQGLYPWGSSLRVYVPKPGTKSLRPITIPPFMDKIVQKAICMVLEAIYEPHFELQNRSFGFRPHKSCHDAILALTSTYSSGKITAIEGDIKAAYDTVNKDKLLEIIGRRVKDRKFLNLVKDRLNYDFVEIKEEGKFRIRPTKGIPQGGIDSPYLFNIYMKELDDYVHNEIKDYLDSLNSNLVVDRSFKRLFNSLLGNKQRLTRNLTKLKKALRDEQDPTTVEILRRKMFETVKEMRLNGHKVRNIKSEHPNKRRLSLLYVRYADDWIILTNANRQIAQIIQEKIRVFLLDKLELTLSPEKTLITDITKEPAHFLGFELRHNKMGPVKKTPVRNSYTLPKKKNYLSRIKGGTIVWAGVDRQRLINRLHMKGFCDKHGFPRELPWLSTLEPHVIVERYNAVIRGFSEYYFNFIRNNSQLQRWIHILRYSCIKTLAQKYRTSIKGILKRFGQNMSSPSDKTICIKVVLKVQDETYEKYWSLWTYAALKRQLSRTNKRKKYLTERFWNTEHNNLIGDYPYKVGDFPTVTNEDYLEKVSWVSLRTQASFAMPCASCLSFNNVHQHHLRHIRKNAYELIPENMSWKQVMALRNRKQVPLCASCHRFAVHRGFYTGLALIKLVPTVKLADNRIVHVESFVKPGLKDHSAKPLIAKGWKISNYK